MPFTRAEFRQIAQERYADALKREAATEAHEDATALAAWRAAREAQFQTHLKDEKSTDFWAWLFDLPPCEEEMRKAS